ncbi:MAG: hypothetical protein JWN18_481 [Parcubacteria group bacterium]|nr:hypothetical protein [Parcubacteria group bacterium]
MCGIQGISTGERRLVEEMNVATAHRGPDDAGIAVDGEVGLGHNRLSILDLSPLGHQPMQTADGAVQIVYNGEIYNFKALRGELEKAGDMFISGSDTEVIMRGYAREGADFFKKLRGMWALALYDRRTHRIVLSRDPFGIKPLYYYLNKGVFAFSSELRGLRPVLSRYGATDNALAHRLYFIFGYMPAPHTPFTEVSKLLPGEVAAFDLKTKTYSHEYTVLPYEESAPSKSLEEALDDTVRAHFVSDVPVGLFYSGGTDSTLLLATARKLGFTPEAFFLRIPNRLDNDYALAAARELGVTPTIFDFDSAAAYATLERTLATLDEPFADSSYIPTEFLSLCAARTHKVVLSGEGGDEFFGGYHRHDHLLTLTKGVPFIPPAAVALLSTRLRRLIEAKINRNPYASYLEFARLDEGSAPRGEALEFLKERISPPYDNLGLSFDQKIYLPDDLLFKIDRAGMQHGLEGRVPFLDKQFFSTVRMLPPEMRHGGIKGGKALLKNLLRAYLPDALVDRPKQGFSMPLVMAAQLPDAIFARAIEHAAAHPELVPLPHMLLSKLREHKNARDAFREKHPQLAYVLLMWGGWQESYHI